MAAVLLSGCGLATFWDEPVPRAPSATPVQTASQPSTTDDRVAHPYDASIAKGATCRRASKEQLADLEEIGNVGGAITYPVGVLVKSNDGWWTAAVATRVAKNSSGYTTKSVARYALFVTSYPTYGEIPDEEPFAWQLSGADGDAAATMALACVKKLPMPPVPPEPGSPETYTGRLARNAKCTALSTKLLDRMEEVGGVGGAITYPRGRMVRANRDWWTVAVATQVNPNGEGLTRDNVPATALFVTNAPSHKASSKTKVVSFPIRAKKSDAAARKALACLG